RTGKLISRCRDCRMGGARPNSGGARPGAGRKPKRLQESGTMRLKLTREMLVECEDGHRACDACGRILPKARFRFPTLYRKGGQIRWTWLPLAVCDACRRRRGAGDLRVSSRRIRGGKAEGRPDGPARNGAGAGMAGPSGLMSRGLKAAAECKRPKYLNVTADSGANQQLQPRNLDALAAALEPLIGPWPANALELGR